MARPRLMYHASCIEEATIVTNILMLAQGTEGDVRPLVVIGQALKARGHHVTILTHCSFETPVRGAGLEYAAIDTVSEYEEMLRHSSKVSLLKDFVEQAQRFAWPTYPAKYNLIQERYVAGQTLLLANSNSYLVARMAAEKLRMPLVTLFLSPNPATSPT